MRLPAEWASRSQAGYAELLEGIANDETDVELAEVLDSWLRRQKQNSETLYSGKVVCNSCHQSWESLLLAADTCNAKCPHCGAIQKIPLIDLCFNNAKA